MREPPASNQGGPWRPLPIGTRSFAIHDPKSRVAAVRIIGFSPSAGVVITVIAIRSDLAGATPWKTSGADLRAYEGQDES